MRKDPLELSKSALAEYYEETLEAFKAYGILDVPDVPLGSPPKMKLCIDCKWHKVVEEDVMPFGFLFWLPWEDKTKDVYQTETHSCHRREQDPLFGETWPIMEYCLKERKTGGCGPDGKYWEAK